MSISEHKHVSEVDAPARRVEIFTGAGRRRTWSADEKAAIVAESRESGARVCQVARRHALTPQQLFAWRREARLRSAGGDDAPSFVPAVIDVVSQSSAAAPNIEARNRNAGTSSAAPPCDRAGRQRDERLDLARGGRRDGDGDHCGAEGRQVIGPTGAVRVMVATKPVWRLRYVSITEHNDVSKGEAPARRLEIFTGAGRRRTWTTSGEGGDRRGDV